MTIILVYHTTVLGSSDSHQACLSAIADIVNQSEEIILCGDFNGLINDVVNSLCNYDKYTAAQA